MNSPMSKLKLTEHIFLMFHEGDLVLWDYKNHEQYVIDQETLEKLLSASKGNIDEKVMQDLIENKILVADEQKIEWGWDRLSKIYHIGCNNLGNVEEADPQKWLEQYIDSCKDVEVPQRCLDISGEEISLPVHTLDNLPAKKPWEVSKRRMTNRVFLDKEIPLQDLSNILYAGFGVIEDYSSEYEEKGYKQTLLRKAHPSGGGLHPLECFVIIYKVKGLESGLYYYNWDKHILINLQKAISIERLTSLFQGQYYVKGIACGLFICNNNTKSWGKYPHSRCYRDTFVDLGHAQQTILYYATYMELETWQTGWFRDQELSDILNIDGNRIFPTGFIGIGRGTREGIAQ